MDRSRKEKSMKRHVRFAAAFAAVLAMPAIAAAEKLVFAWGPNPQTPQVDVALKNGYFEEAGLEVELVAFRTGREGFEAMLGGQVDVTFMAEFPAVAGALRDQEFGIIADLARFTGSRIIGTSKLGDFDDPSALDGLKIGTTLGTNVDFFLNKVLDGAGVSAEIVNASPVDLVNALARGDVDAIVPFPTFYAGAKKTLGDDYRELRAPGYQPHFVLAASPEMLNERSDVLDKFIAALVRADADVAADPSAAMDAVVASLQGAIPKESLEVMWQDVDIGMKLDSELLDLLLAEAEWVLAQGIIKADPLTAEVMRAHFAEGALAAAKPEAVNLP